MSEALWLRDRAAAMRATIECPDFSWSVSVWRPLNPPINRLSPDAIDVVLDHLQAVERVRADLLARVAELEGELKGSRAEVERLRWRRIDGPGIDGQRVMLRELDPFDSLNRGDENRDVIASGYWSDDYGYYVWPFGCTDHPPTHWAPMPDRLTDERKGGGA